MLFVLRHHRNSSTTAVCAHPKARKAYANELSLCVYVLGNTKDQCWVPEALMMRVYRRSAGTDLSQAAEQTVACTQQTRVTRVCQARPDLGASSLLYHFNSLALPVLKERNHCCCYVQAASRMQDSSRYLCITSASP